MAPWFGPQLTGPTNRTSPVCRMSHALFDCSRSIRELARFKLRKFDIDQAKVAAMYRTAIENQTELFPALEGLAEVGDLSDTRIFRERLKHRLPTRRSAAIIGSTRVRLWGGKMKSLNKKSAAIFSKCIADLLEPGDSRTIRFKTKMDGPMSLCMSL